MQTQFVREGMNQFFVVNRNDEWEGCYEETLFTVSKVPCFLPYEIREINGNTAIYYQMSYRTSLRQAFECVTFSSKMIENIIKSIIDVLDTCCEYLVSPDNILFESEHIFFDIDSGNLKFCYYYNKKEGQSLSDLVMEIICHIDKKRGRGAVRLLKFYDLLTSPGFDVEKIRYQMGNSADDIAIDNPVNDKEEHFESMEIADTISIDESFVKRKDKKIIIADVIKKCMMAVGVIDVVLLIGLILNVLTYEKMGFLFIGMAVLIALVIIYMHFEPEESPEEIMADYIKTSQNSICEKTTYDDEHDICDGATVLLCADADISCVVEEKITGLYLKPAQKGRCNPIHINNSSIVIGSMQGCCDYFLNEKGISRLHAKIMEKPDGMYIMDMNSTNGTYLNGEILQPGAEYQFEEGDMISFADIQFFVLREV